MKIESFSLNVSLVESDLSLGYDWIINILLMRSSKIKRLFLIPPQVGRVTTIIENTKGSFADSHINGPIGGSGGMGSMGPITSETTNRPGAHSSSNPTGIHTLLHLQLIGPNGVFPRLSQTMKHFSLKPRPT